VCLMKWRPSSWTSSFQVRTAGGLTEEIPQERGVKQGCPISPLVFNLAIEGLIRGIEGLIRGIESSSSRGYSFSDGLEVKSLAYADDLAIASSSEEDIKVMLARLEEFTSWAHLRFNVAKCASLSTTYQGGKRVVLQSSFQLQGQDIPAMEWEDRYRHLGVLLGPNPEACLDKLADEGEHGKALPVRPRRLDEAGGFQGVCCSQTGLCASVYPGA